ncbi:hypothetical protein SUGI_1144380 [Cryptomeria japonica]|nr:hypothetical protein SUGI_1144380 [Cryptomeria japonica]
MLYTIVHSETLSKICCQGNPNYNLAERNGDVVLALANDSDPYQQWMINSTLGSMIGDEVGFSSISIVNKGTGHVLTHVKHNHQVVVGNFGKDEFQREYLWTQSKPKDDGYQSVLPFNNINMALQAEVPVNNKSISGGIKVTLYKRNDSEIHQKWKIMPIGPPGEVVHIYSEANADYFLTARGDFAVLSLGSSSDAHQEWIKVVSWGERVKDEAGFPAFALVNKATLKALKHGNSEWDQIFVTDYTEITLDVSILWTESADVGNGYRCIRPLEETEQSKMEDGNRKLMIQMLNEQQVGLNEKTMEEEY